LILSRLELVVGSEGEGGSSKELSRSRGGHGKADSERKRRKDVSFEAGWVAREGGGDEMEGRRTGRTKGELLENLAKGGWRLRYPRSERAVPS